MNPCIAVLDKSLIRINANSQVRGSTLRSRTPEYQEKLKDQFLKHALPKLVDGTFESKVDRVVDWNEIREAHEAMERNEIMGKIICTVG
jgi:NADPH:quinone reductase-like Zn-dependent oxidoreductase